MNFTICKNTYTDSEAIF